MKRRWCSAIFVRNLRQTPLHQQKDVQILEPSTLHRHKDCKEHEDAVNEEAMRDTFNNTQHHVFRAQSQVILTAMRAVYWLAKEDVATVKYNSLLNFLDEVGLKQIFKWEEMLQNNLIKVLKVCEMLLLLF